MKRKIFSILFALMLALSFSLITATPAAANPTWGATLTADTTLDSNLTGSGTALIIGADGITLDLNGYTLSGDSTGYGVDNTGGYDDVTIKNGDIVGFGQGIRADGTIGTPLSGLTLENLSFSGDTGGGHGHVIDIRNGANVVIEDVEITVGSGSPSWAEAIRLQSIDGVEVINADVDGGWIGVNFAFDSVGDPPTNGIVKDSFFTGNGFIGVFIANSTSAMVKGNTITDTGWLAGIYAGSFGSGQVVTGVVIKDNDVSGGTGYGIALAGVDNCVVSGNQVLDDFDCGGIALYWGASNSVHRNTVTDNHGDGISVEEASDSIHHNTVTNSAGYGIHLTSTSNGNTVHHNTLSGNTAGNIQDDGTNNKLFRN